MKQEELCCFSMKFVAPSYPKEARLARIEGVVKVILVIADDNSIADLQAVSGEPILLDSTMTAVRQWRFFSTIGKIVGKPTEIEVPITFTFKIEDPPKPAYLHLANGKVVRADEVREFTDRMEYSAGGRTHHIAPNLVTDIDGCARIVIRPQKERECIAGGGPYFVIRAIPLLPAANASGRPASH